jgi:hypothetical protein
LQCFNPSKISEHVLEKKKGRKSPTGNGIAVFRIGNMAEEKHLETQLKMGIMTSKFQ